MQYKRQRSKSVLNKRLAVTNNIVRRHVLKFGFTDEFVEKALAVFFKCVDEALDKGEAVELPGGWIWCDGKPSPESIQFNGTFLFAKENLQPDEIVDLLELFDNESIFINQEDSGVGEDFNNGKPEDLSF